MPDIAAPEAPPKLHWKTREKLEREAAASVTTPADPAPETVTGPEVSIPPAPTKRKPVILPFDEFALRFFISNADFVLRMMQANGIQEAGGGLSGLLEKSYSVYRHALTTAWDRLGE